MSSHIPVTFYNCFLTSLDVSGFMLAAGMDTELAKRSVMCVVKLSISRCQELCSVIYIYHPVVQSSS